MLKLYIIIYLMQIKLEVIGSLVGFSAGSTGSGLDLAHSMP